MSMFNGGELILGQELAGPVPINRLVNHSERAAVYVLGASFWTKQIAICAAVCWRDEDLVMGDGLLLGPRPASKIKMVVTLPDGRTIEPWPIGEFRPGHGLRTHVTWLFEPPIPEGLIQIESEWDDAGLPARTVGIDTGPLIAGMLTAKPAWPPAVTEQ